MEVKPWTFSQDGHNSIPSHSDDYTLDHWIQIGLRAHRLDREEEHPLPTNPHHHHEVLNATVLDLGFDSSCLNELDEDLLKDPSKAFADVLWEQSVYRETRRRPRTSSSELKPPTPPPKDTLPTLTLLTAVPPHVKFSPIQIVSRRSSCETDESEQWPLTPPPLPLSSSNQEVKVAQHSHLHDRVRTFYLFLHNISESLQCRISSCTLTQTKNPLVPSSTSTLRHLLLPRSSNPSRNNLSTTSNSQNQKASPIKSLPCSHCVLERKAYLGNSSERQSLSLQSASSFLLWPFLNADLVLSLTTYCHSLNCVLFLISCTIRCNPLKYYLFTRLYNPPTHSLIIHALALVPLISIY